jgi:hypothetical protein
MSESTIAFTRKPSEETTVDVFGVNVTFLVEGEPTGDRCGVLEYVSMPTASSLARTGR